MAAALMAATGGGAASAATQFDDATPTSWLSPQRLYLHVGPGALIMDESAKLYEYGQRIPGANVTIAPQVTAIGEIGYMINRNIGVSFTGGYPPTATVVAAGTLKGYGEVGRSTYGPMAFTAHYHFKNMGPFQPYVGAGPVVMAVFANYDALLKNVDTHPSVGVAVQGGAEYRINRHWGAFFDVKKAWLSTTATGDLGPAPIRARIQMNPVVLNGGVAFHF